VTVVPDAPPVPPCEAEFDPLTGLLNLRKMHSWRDGSKKLDCCRLCGVSKVDLKRSSKTVTRLPKN
jgi:hypothetical protein